MVCVTKGIENGTLMRMSQVVQTMTGHCVVLHRPAMQKRLPSPSPPDAWLPARKSRLQNWYSTAFMTENFRIYTSPDLIGAELGGALKNVIALCAGVSDGLGYGDNTKAMLMTRGLTEIARLGVRSWLPIRKPSPVLPHRRSHSVTCTSMHSRNRRAGILIGQGMSPDAAMKQIGAVVEGYYASRSAWELARSLGVEMPIINAAYRVLYDNADAGEVVRGLLLRDKKPESEDAGWL